MTRPAALLLAALFWLASGCATLAIADFDQRFGTPDPTRYDRPLATGSVDYWRDVKPVLDSRCVVCHACYDAPCQLKLGSWEGISRGAHPDKVYNGERLIAANLTRLFEDAHTTAQWRDKGFFPVLNERTNTPQANLEGSTLARMLLLKQDHPLPTDPLLADSFDLELNRSQQCTRVEKFSDYREKYPLWGMPYGLPGLAPREHNVLLQWVKDGAPYQPRNPVTSALQQQIDQWEAFLNQDFPKAQLMSRYLFEHLYLAHLHFPDVTAAGTTPVFFDLVRSATPPGQPVQRIATRRPFDDPGVARVYYRLQPVREAIAAKIHMPYRLDAARLQRWQDLFLKPVYAVTALPSYKIEEASNPFITFRQLPTQARYRFLLDEAQYSIMNFIKGPVCRGQLALNVINDHFWVVFVDPDLASADLDSNFMAEQLQQLELPAEAESTVSPLRWLKYAEKEKRYLEAKSRFLNEAVKGHLPLDLNLLWDGDGHNQNAALTIFRHSDSASVEKGLLGERPQTAWVLNYPLLERIHYLLVAGYDVYGNVGHQLSSRIYMDFLRMEGEFNFLALLPKKQREKVRRQWYRGSVNEVKEYVYQSGNRFDGETAIRYQTGQPLTELYGLLQQKLAPVQSQQHSLAHGFSDPASLAALQAIGQLRGTSAAILPQTLFIRVDGLQQTHYYTLLHHNAYSNISHIFLEDNRRRPKEDTVSLEYGLIGAYPSALLQVPQAELPRLAAQLQNLKDETGYRQLLDRFGVRRTHPGFWAFSDQLHAAWWQAQPLESGWLDYNRLENR